MAKNKPKLVRKRAPALVNPQEPTARRCRIFFRTKPASLPAVTLKKSMIMVSKRTLKNSRPEIPLITAKATAKKGIKENKVEKANEEEINGISASRKCCQVSGMVCCKPLTRAKISP